MLVFHPQVVFDVMVFNVEENVPVDLVLLEFGNHLHYTHTHTERERERESAREQERERERGRERDAHTYTHTQRVMPPGVPTGL